ncbi:MAG: diaminopimelate epimerase [Myxococcales bacterium]|jgi:diaminopimelate epimerase
MGLRFSKYEGLGNDFLVVDCAPDAIERDRVVRLCDRHLGVGGDGVLFTGGGAPTMHVVNADGSVPEMCGNGLRCVALHLLRSGRVSQREFDVRTGAGPHACRVLSMDGGGDRQEAQVEVAMRPASLQPAEVPVVADAPLIDAPFEVAGRTLHVTAVSMGNPHAVIFDDVGEARLELGPAVQADARFPSGVNVGFARVVDDGLVLHVCERGAGWTRACGTGACAAAVAAVETGRARRGEPLRVLLPGGPLTIVVGESDAPIMMTGPARHVFDGELPQ